MGKIFYIMGKSSSGKDTIYENLLGREGLSLHPLIMYTTRPIRAGETDGVQYHFVTEEQLKALEHAGKVIELRTYQTVYGPWHYFTVDDGQINLEKGNYLYIGTLESYEQMVRYYGKEVVVPIYVEVETGERLTRAVNRERQQENPKYTELCRRFLADEEDFCEENIKKAGIKKRYENNSLERCIEEIVEDIRDFMVL